jgi:hypothetical protein
VAAVKYPIGSEVELVDYPGRTGTVCLFKEHPRPLYGLDVHPGAVGGYEWIWLKPPHYKRPTMLPINWISERRLRAAS